MAKGDGPCDHCGCPEEKFDGHVCESYRPMPFSDPAIPCGTCGHATPHDKIDYNNGKYGLCGRIIMNRILIDDAPCNVHTVCKCDGMAVVGV